MRQEEATADRLVARFSVRKFAPHAVLGWATVGLSAAWLASFGDRGTAALGLALFGLATIVLVAGGALMVKKLELVVDHQGIRCPGDALVVPWGDVVSLDLTGRSVLRVEVRDGPGLLARQSPGLSMWRMRRQRLAERGVLDCPVGGLDRSPAEILDAAMRLRALGGGAPPQVSWPDARDARRRRLIVAVSVAGFVLQLLALARVYLS
jgi:hypothetical protein